MSTVRGTINPADLRVVTPDGHLQRCADVVRSMELGLYVYRLEDLRDDRLLRIVECNPAAVRFTGVGSEIVGRLIDECFPGLRRLGIPRMLAQVVCSGRAIDLGEVAYGEDGVREGVYAAKAFPLPDQCVGVVFEDVTPRVRAEERLARQSLEGRLLHSISAMAAETEAFEDALRHGIVALCRINRWAVGHAYIPAQDGSGDLVSAGIWHDPGGGHFEALREFCRNQRYGRGLDLPGRILASREPEWVQQASASETFPRAAQCEGAGIVGVCGFPILVGREVTAVLEFFSRQPMVIDAGLAGVMRTIGQQVGRVLEREQARRQRDALHDRLHQAQKIEALGQLAGGVAHDFNNLLTVIRSTVDQLATELPDGDATRRCLSVIQQATQEAIGVTQSLLTFSRDMPASRQPIDIVDLVRDTTNLLRRMLPAVIELRLDLPRGRMWILGDSTQLRQVIMNLAINARDAMPLSGALTVELSRDRSQGRAGTWACLEVRDTGCGMTPEMCSRALEPFFTTKPRGQGTGLGLSIVHGVIQEHEGEIDIRSGPEQGTSVIVRLPCLPRVVRPLASARPSAAPRKGRGQLVLLAEDHPQVRAILSSALQSFGYEVLKAGDGAAALKYHRVYDRTIALVVLDVDLPRKNGMESLLELRRRGLAAPAILITGNPAPIDRAVLDQRTVVLQKPFQMDELGRMAYQLLEQAGSS